MRMKFLSLFFLLCGFYGSVAQSRVSVLTCSPGNDLYSVFGHTAIRVFEQSEEGIRDVVYNYGVFQFDDSFYWKFACGRLDYLLLREPFHEFQWEYLQSGREVIEQELLLDSAQKAKLLFLLEENAKPENRVYRYDFFYDNCATRVRDMIARALMPQEDQLGFANPDTSLIHSLFPGYFPVSNKGDITYRQAIHVYLESQPWSHFGIDLALGLPCDDVVNAYGMMFLPDSLSASVSALHVDDRRLVGENIELLPGEANIERSFLFTPLRVFSLWLLIHVVWWVLFRKYQRLRFLLTRILLFVSGALGVLVFFLWFFTDHQTTVVNLNILWANPWNLILCFLPFSWVVSRWYWYAPTLIPLVFFTLFGGLLPQEFHWGVWPLVVMLLFSAYRVYQSFTPKTNVLQ
jgi:hypothetical protein